MEGIIAAWGRILAGYTPNLSIEITRECPLRCPGCYAYGADHLGGDINLRQVADYKGEALITEVMRLVDEHRALHLSIVGGEPLVRYRELNDLLPKLADMGVYTQLVTSAVRPIPIEWASIRRLQLVVSIDGLQPEHDVRRTPATYDRILKHIKGHKITVHCTVTRQQVRRDGLPRRVPRLLVEQSGHQPDLGQPLHAADRRGLRGTAPPRRSRARRRRPDQAPREVSEAADARGHDQGLRDAARFARRVHLRADHDVLLRRPRRRGSVRASSAAIPTARSAAASPRPG